MKVHADTRYRTVSDYIKAVKAAPGKFKMGGTGSKQEDEIITRALQQEAKVKFIYVAYKGGGDVAKALVAKEIDSTVNNPAEAMEEWRAGKVRPLAVFDSQRLPQKEKVTASASWNDVPTMKEQGYSVEYLMLRGIFAVPGISEEVQDYYIQLLQTVTRTPEWQGYLRQGALKNRFMTKELFNSWLEFSETIHKTLLQARTP
jgi:putative tricarboxylic transport membrane protein